jgi:hypothetical protein
MLLLSEAGQRRRRKLYLSLLINTKRDGLSQNQEVKTERPEHLTPLLPSFRFCKNKET